VASSGNGGKTFQKTIVSHDQWDINACPIAGPSLCIGSKDQVYIVWFTGSGDRPALYYAGSSNHGVSYSPRKLLDASRTFGKHAQAVPLSDGKVIVAWEGQAEHPVIFRGILDIRQGLQNKSVARQQATYPTLAVNTKTAVIAGLQSSQDIFVNADDIQVTN
jgi:hypothetical protein